ncbi:T9SS type A sorting domain-containing protein [Sediminibacterium soli]|uniref:T9SS type A sorting domain-containing protein n=1 Tax=Sediminibacterium soli TaxID=2698829 RepID=UPI00137AE7C4|nr:T9SS type A sorting domain-containing protein [Sediminibacterium soli]NCI47916.1 T9SS type A sorting domain-containing protein [Sediminibacterium soli]
MRINKAVYIILILVLAAVHGKTQMVFSMVPMAGSSNGATFSSNPIIVDGGKCVVSSSGLSAMMVANSGKGAFNDGCKETPPVATIEEFSISLNIYPNPTHGPATIKCSGQFDENLSCQIRIISMDGKMMFSKMVPIKELKAGYQVNAASYAVGTYAVLIDFMNQRYSLKLMKM